MYPNLSLYGYTNGYYYPGIQDTFSPMPTSALTSPHYFAVTNAYNPVPKNEVETKELESTESISTRKRQRSPEAETNLVFKKAKLTDTPEAKKERRREKNRQYAQQTRERKKLQLNTLLDQQQKTIQLGQKIENYVEEYKQAFPSTTLPTPDINLTNTQLSEDEKVPPYQRRIEQITEIMTREAKELKMKNDALAKRNALLEQQFQLLQRKGLSTNFS